MFIWFEPRAAAENLPEGTRARLSVDLNPGKNGAITGQVTLNGLLFMEDGRVKFPRFKLTSGDYGPIFAMNQDDRNRFTRYVAQAWKRVMHYANNKPSIALRYCVGWGGKVSHRERDMSKRGLWV
jgi:hypothetical protein